MGSVTISAQDLLTDEPIYVANWCTGSNGNISCPVTYSPSASSSGTVQKPTFLEVVSSFTDNTVCLGLGCAAILQYRVLD